MFASVIMIAVFTASVTSSLTVTKLQGAVRDEADLRRVRVGAVGGSSTILYLKFIKASTPNIRRQMRAWMPCEAAR